MPLRDNMETAGGLLRRHGRVIGLTGLLAVGVGAIGYRAVGPSNPSTVRTPVRLICTTSECGKTFRAELLPGDRPACPRCGAPAVPAFDCPGCGKPIVLNAYRAIPEPARCRHCRRTISEEVSRVQEE